MRTFAAEIPRMPIPKRRQVGYSDSFMVHRFWADYQKRSI